ncbi:putative secologanin synthase [Helianthus debilis subsp. tardiflorus]
MLPSLITTLACNKHHHSINTTFLHHFVIRFRKLSLEMEVSGAGFGVAIIVIILGWCSWRMYNFLWLKPKRTEMFLRNQGLKGNSYKFFLGDFREMVKMVNDAKTKPINQKSDAIPRVLPFEHKYLSAYGKNFFTWLGPVPVVHVTEPALVKEVLTNSYEFQKPRGGDPLFKLLIVGIASFDTDEWSKHRRIINPAFHAEKLKSMVPAFYKCCAEMINKWDDILKSKSSGEVDIVPYIKRMSCDVISNNAFGSSFKDGQTQRIFDLLAELVDFVVKSKQTVYIPGSSLLPTKRNLRMKEIKRELTAMIRNVVEERITAVKQGEPNKEDLLGILLESNSETIKEHGDEKSGLSIDEIIEECQLFYVIGHETTENFIIWSMVLLAQHPEWQTRARDEVVQAFGKKTPDSRDALNRLKTLNMILNEALRLYPPAPIMPRMIYQDTKLGDMTLPAGTIINLHIMLMHHDRDLWGDDVKEFKPERFSEGVSKVTKGQTSFIPFSTGPRICLALNSTMLEAKLVLAMTLQHFRFELSPSYSHAPYVYVALEPQFGVPMILHKL